MSLLGHMRKSRSALPRPVFPGQLTPAQRTFIVRLVRSALCQDQPLVTADWRNGFRRSVDLFELQYPQN
jgi:hypothetical protein